MLCSFCDYMYINNVGCHEIGCPKSGEPIHIEKRRYYIGIRKTDRSRILVQTRLTPNEQYYPEYVAFIGPFKTKRAAIWGIKNPHSWDHVSEAEVLSRKVI